MKSDKAGAARQSDYYAGSRWLQAGVIALLLSLLAWRLIVALSEANEQAERQMVESTLSHLRSGQIHAQGEAIVHAAPPPDTRNPIDWLGAPPSGYRGNCPANGVLAAGGWCFDAGRGILHYRPRAARLQAGCDTLQWRLEKPPGASGQQLQAVGECRWQ